MSLTNFLDMKDVNAKVKPLRPRQRRMLDVPLKVEPRSDRYSLVGTAFDYLLRFELQRRAPYAVSETWIAELALPRIWVEKEHGFVGIDRLRGVDPKYYMPPQLIAKYARQAVADAKVAVCAYMRETAPSKGVQAEMASHAIRLANFDPVFRGAMKLAPTFREVHSEDIDDLLEMLAIVPFEQLLHPTIILLNPSFGETSRLVGGADADLIAGDFLVDIKATKKPAMDEKQLDQLLGLFLLARKHRVVNPDFPAINRLGLYFARHGLLWSLDASDWMMHPEFGEIETWFFQHAAELRALREERRLRQQKNNT